jgi:hypothetical protein
MAEPNKTKEPRVETKSEPKTASLPPIASVTPPTAPSAPAAPATPPPAASTANTPPPAVPEAKKPVWPWVLGGCLILIVISLVGIGILGWLGLQSAKSLIQKYEPTINQTQKTIDTVNQEATKWQETSQQVRDSLPNPEDLQKMQADLPNPQDMQGLPNFQKASP